METIVLASSWSRADDGVETTTATLLEPNGELVQSVEVHNPHSDRGGSQIEYSVLGHLDRNGHFDFATDHDNGGSLRNFFPTPTRQELMEWIGRQPGVLSRFNLAGGQLQQEDPIQPELPPVADLPAPKEAKRHSPIEISQLAPITVQDPLPSPPSRRQQQQQHPMTSQTLPRSVGASAKMADEIDATIAMYLSSPPADVQVFGDKSAPLPQLDSTLPLAIDAPPKSGGRRRVQSAIMMPLDVQDLEVALRGDNKPTTEFAPPRSTGLGGSLPRSRKNTSDSPTLEPAPAPTKPYQTMTLGRTPTASTAAPVPLELPAKPSKPTKPTQPAATTTTLQRSQSQRKKSAVRTFFSKVIGSPIKEEEEEGEQTQSAAQGQETLPPLPASPTKSPKFSTLTRIRRTMSTRRAEDARPLPIPTARQQDKNSRRASLDSNSGRRPPVYSPTTAEHMPKPVDAAAGLIAPAVEPLPLGEELYSADDNFGIPEIEVIDLRDFSPDPMHASAHGHSLDVQHGHTLDTQHGQALQGWPSEHYDHSAGHLHSALDSSHSDGLAWHYADGSTHLRSAPSPPEESIDFLSRSQNSNLALMAWTGVMNLS